ncbi:MAG: Fe-S-containing hydro-lyase [Deltaproteobacteria bacterium]|nr:Fe-S-containing hydro-lyase [Deltaproteobacteria bacterium]
MTEPIRLTPPLEDRDLENLRIGDSILLSGVLYTARDAAHKRMIDLLDRGEGLPFDIRGQVIYYVGPSPARPGRVVGAAGPTTSYRMDDYSPRLMERGLKGMIGKGIRSKEVIEAMVRYHCVYMAAVGGAGALLSKCIKKAEVIAYEDLGPEAVRRLEVEDFPVILVNDIRGNDLYQEGMKRYER